MIVLEGVKKSFGKKKILTGVNLKINEGSSLVIIGRSGTGKSVLIKCILALENYDEGTIHINKIENSNKNNKTFYDQFGMLFQGGALFDSIPIWENISFRLLRGNQKISRSDAKQLASEKLKLVGLNSDIIDLYPSELSGGMQKRVALARAIAGDPKVIFFDEPTTGLDPIMANVINRLIREIVVEMGVTAITITHDINSTRIIADDVAMLDSGKVQWKGEINHLDNSGNKMVDQFINGLATGPISNNY
ncbi:MAG: ATP-binding cassette domain-containing protein [Paracoccaceae bacterium]|jgi:phospholipid/cholesterol/gamma-HCH transport system ATP-binding protein|nr:ATP-binding cassette domain-containing protein [Paracoccaceae bacterium]|tara:strand:- start:329 stop:1075 length:747 start_codon:yes stop_codon:yes gene_type:complete